MNRFNIVFKDLKTIHSSLSLDEYGYFVDYLNSFKGENILQKTYNILKCWNNDVSSTFSYSKAGKKMDVSIFYMLDNFPTDFGESFIIVDDDLEICLDIPKKFDTLDTIPIRSLIQYIKISDKFINLLELDEYNRDVIIDNLPPKMFNRILNVIANNKSKTLQFYNPLLNDFSINFITNEPLIFLKGLFSRYSDDYFTNIVFYLSKRIGYDAICDSTPFELEFYAEKYTKEIEEHQKGLHI